jgi:hypothetical protein
MDLRMLFVSRRVGAETLEFVEEALDEVAEVKVQGAVRVLFLYGSA